MKVAIIAIVLVLLCSMSSLSSSLGSSMLASSSPVPAPPQETPNPPTETQETPNPPTETQETQEILGCMDESAINYSPVVTVQDESCQYKRVARVKSDDKCFVKTLYSDDVYRFIASSECDGDNIMEFNVTTDSADNIISIDDKSMTVLTLEFLFKHDFGFIVSTGADSPVSFELDDQNNIGTVGEMKEYKLYTSNDVLVAVNPGTEAFNKMKVSSVSHELIPAST